MKDNPLIQLEKHGQSIWLDYIRRDLMTSGELSRLIREDGLRGMTSNPSIFEMAIADSQDYNADIQSMTKKGMVAEAIYEAISQHDVKMAADEFRSVYDDTDGKDGFVSLEINPHLAHDTNGTIEEARRLWRVLDSPNVLIKVPATMEGLPAIKELISEGINVNITLLFGLHRYRQAVEAFVSGMEARLVRGKALKQVASVASFFLSRIDTMIDPLLESIVARQSDDKAEITERALGQVAIASAKTAYMIYKEIFGGERFQKLVEKGARPQRLLWASTSTKNPNYSDIKYIEAIIGSDTINTVPMETLNAFRDHGNAKNSIEHDTHLSASVLERLPEQGINIEKITQQLEDEGVEKFCKSFDKLIKVLEQRSLLYFRSGL